MNILEFPNQTFTQFKQLEHDYIGYQSLTDVPKIFNGEEELKSYSSFDNKTNPEIIEEIRNNPSVYARSQLHGILLKREGPNYEINNLTVKEHLQHLYHKAGCMRHWATVRFTSSLLHHTVDSISPFITAVLVHGKQVCNFLKINLKIHKKFYSSQLV